MKLADKGRVPRQGKEETSIRELVPLDGSVKFSSKRNKPGLVDSASMGEVRRGEMGSDEDEDLRDVEDVDFRHGLCYGEGYMGMK